MNTIKEKFVPQRNITPNFIRFKRTFTLIQAKIVMANLQHRNRIIERILNNRNVVLPKLVDVALKCTRKEF